MPAGIAVGTLAIGRSGAVNAALLAASILGTQFAQYREALRKHREAQTAAVLAHADPREAIEA
jgi:5-(carboxyamino)imidazole ribonucleotide mutase